MSKIVELAELAAAVPDGATVAVGGFQLSRVPVALLRALVRRGATDLTAISAPNPLALDVLAGAGALRAADCGFIGLQYEDGFAVAPALRRAVAAGTLALRQRDVYDTLEALRAAARNDAPAADFALLHVQCADAAGNLAIDDPYADVVLAHGSRRVIATAEALVDSIADPTIAADRVEGVAVVERGAEPTACFGHYRRDAAGVRAWLGDAAPSSPLTSAAGDVAADFYLVNLARQVRDGEVVVTGLASAVPMLAIALAQRTHAPGVRYINCIGAVNPAIGRAWPTSVEPELLALCEETIDLPAIFDLARGGGIDAMFFGAAQIDGRANINLERIGPRQAPKVRLPGPAGSPSMRSWVRRVIVGVPRQSPRTLVERVDAVTSAAAERNRDTVLVTDLAVWRLENGHFVPAAPAPGIDRQRLSSATGFAVDGELPAAAPPPSELELAALHHIDADGLRYRLLARRPSSRTTPQPPDKVLHER